MAAILALYCKTTKAEFNIDVPFALMTSAASAWTCASAILPLSAVVPVLIAGLAFSQTSAAFALIGKRQRVAIWIQAVVPMVTVWVGC